MSDVQRRSEFDERLEPPTWSARFENLAPVTKAATIALLVGLASAIDAVTGPQISMLLLYSLVTATAGWIANERGALVAATVSSAAAATIRILDPISATTTRIELLNAVLRTVSLALLGVVVVRQKRLIRQLRTNSIVDPLTGVLNRAGLMQRLQREIDRARRSSGPLTVAYLDLDELKSYNDRLGHRAGDELITRLTTIIESTLRSTDAIGRMGGDEFVVVFADTGAAGARRLIDRLCRAPGLPAVSIGVVSYGSVPADVGAYEIIERAAEAMYRAKRGDVGPVVVVEAPAPDPAGTDEHSTVHAVPVRSFRYRALDERAVDGLARRRLVWSAVRTRWASARVDASARWDDRPGEQHHSTPGPETE